MSQQISPDAARIARVNMVESQIRPNKVYDVDVLKAMLNVPREMFVPDTMKPLAYADDTLKIAPGRYLAEPLVAARLLEAAELKPDKKVMIVGSGNGYLALIAAMLAAHVTAVEEHDELRGWAEWATATLNIRNIVFYGGRLAEGCRDSAPYDAIIVDGAVASLPRALPDQLAEQGRLVVVMGEPNKDSHGTLVERAGGKLSTRIVFDAALPLLPGFEAKAGFAFA